MEQRGATYRGLAAATGLSAGYLNHLVHGNRPVPTNAVIGRLAAALEVQPEHFRELRLRRVQEQLAVHPELIDRLYKQLARH
jgi:transcriptional regulator with XRE-family HTH domain